MENLLQGMKVFRRVATRYDKLDVTFVGFVHIAGTMKWLNRLSEQGLVTHNASLNQTLFFSDRLGPHAEVVLEQP